MVFGARIVDLMNKNGGYIKAPDDGGGFVKFLYIYYCTFLLTFSCAILPISMCSPGSLADQSLQITSE